MTRLEDCFSVQLVNRASNIRESFPVLPVYTPPVQKHSKYMLCFGPTIYRYRRVVTCNIIIIKLSLLLHEK